MNNEWLYIENNKKKNFNISKLKKKMSSNCSKMFK